MKKYITGLFVPVGGKPELKEIENNLEHLQALVGGYIETDRVLPGIVAIVNEEGVINDLPRNRGIRGRMYFGNVFFVRAAGEDFASLMVSDVDEIQKLYLRDIVIPYDK